MSATLRNDSADGGRCIPVTRVSFGERRVGRFDIILLTKLSRPSLVHSRTAAMHLPWLD